MDKPDFSAKSTYEKIKLACEYILESEGRFTSDNTLSGVELFEKAKKEFLNDFTDMVSTTFYQYLSNSVKDAKSVIAMFALLCACLNMVVYYQHLK